MQCSEQRPAENSRRAESSAYSGLSAALTIHALSVGAQHFRNEALSYMNDNDCTQLDNVRAQGLQTICTLQQEQPCA